MISSPNAPVVQQPTQHPALTSASADRELRSPSSSQLFSKHRQPSRHHFFPRPRRSRIRRHPHHRMHMIRHHRIRRNLHRKNRRQLRQPILNPLSTILPPTIATPAQIRLPHTPRNHMKRVAIKKCPAINNFSYRPLLSYSWKMPAIFSPGHYQRGRPLLISCYRNRFPIKFYMSKHLEVMVRHKTFRPSAPQWQTACFVLSLIQSCFQLETCHA